MWSDWKSEDISTLYLQEDRIKAIDGMEDEKAKSDGVDSQTTAAAANAPMTAYMYKKLLVDVDRDWTNEKNRVLGHVTFSPPITEIDHQMINNTNFIANVIDIDSTAAYKLR